MKKIVIFLDTDNTEIIEKIYKSFKDGIVIMPKGVGEIWELDELNNMKRIV